MRRILYMPGFSHAALILARLTCWAGFKPKLLEYIITTECEFRLHQMTLRKPAERLGGQFFIISKFLPEVLQMTRPELSRKIGCVEQIMRALILIESWCGGRDSNANSKKIAQTGLKLMEQMPEVSTRDASKKLEIQDRAFVCRHILCQVHDIFRLASKGFVFTGDKVAQVVDLDEQEVRSILSSLTENHGHRSNLLGELGAGLEEYYFIGKTDQAPDLVDKLDSNMREDVLQLVKLSGIMTAEIVFFLTLVSGRNEIMTNYINSIRALGFCAELVGEEEPLLGKYKQRLVQLSESLSEPWMHKLSAELKDKIILSRFSDWRESLFAGNGVLSEEDFEYVIRQVDSDHLSSGPEYCQVGQKQNKSSATHGH